MQIFSSNWNLLKQKSKDCKEFLDNVARGKLKAVVSDYILDSVAVVMQTRGSLAIDIREVLHEFALLQRTPIAQSGFERKDHGRQRKWTKKNSISMMRHLSP